MGSQGIKTLNYVMYCRRSQDREDKQILSIGSQKTELDALADRRGLRVIKVLEESMSAKEPGRPVFNEMLRMIDEKEVDGIICWKFDRLTRNPIDGGGISYRLQKGNIKQIVTFERDYNPEDNVILMSVEAGMANQYIIDLSRNVKRGMRAKVQQGWLPNRPTCGWVYDKNTKTIVKDEYNFPRVQKLLEIALTGKYNSIELVNIANEKLHIKFRVRGQLMDKMVGKNYILGLLRNPFHAGMIVYAGEQYDGAHEAMITKAGHEHLVELYGEIGSRTETSPMTKLQERLQKYDTKLRGLFVCPCGRQVSPWRVKNREGGKTYLYYTCGSRFGKKRDRCGQPIIRAGDLEDKVRVVLQNTQIDERLLTWVKENLQSELLNEETEQKATLVSLKKRKEQLEMSKKRLVDLLLSGTVTEDAYQTKDRDLDDEIRSIAKTLREEDERIERLKQESKEAVKIADKLVAIFDGDDFAKTKQMLRSVFDSMKLEDGQPVLELKKPFQVILTLRKIDQQET